MIILDEAHRIPAKILSEIQDLSDHLDIAVVLVGTDRLNTLLEQDEQVDLRFCHRYHFKCLDADELREMTALWEEHVLQLAKPSNLTTVKAQNMLYPATRGYIGLLDQILCEAATRVIQQGKSYIDLDTRPFMNDPEVKTINSWMFRVTAYPGESFGHFLSRFRRANYLSSGQLSAILGLRYLAVSYWETPSRRRMPDKKNWKLLSDMTGVAETNLRSMLMPKSIALCLRTRLCSLCYGEEPFHRLIWQNANIVECDRHGCELLSMCPQCGIDFQLPALWESGQCEQCYLPFYDMNKFRRSIEGIFT